MDNATLVICHERQSVSFDELLESVAKSVPCSSCDFAGIGAGDFLYCSVTCQCRKRICRQSSSYICSMLSCSKACCHKLCIFLLAAYAACSRISACNDFSEDGKVRNHIEVLLRSADSYTEARYNLIEYQQCSVSVAKLSYALIVVYCHRPCAAFRTHRLYDYRCCAAR